MGLLVRIAISAHIYAERVYAALWANLRKPIDVVELIVNIQSSVHQMDVKMVNAAELYNVEVLELVVGQNAKNFRALRMI